MTSVLVVDDSRVQRIKLARQMRTLGYTVVEASNGEEGVARFSEEEIDAVVTDIHMPVMDGLKMLEIIVSRNSKVPVLVYTTDSESDSFAKAQKLGAAGYLVKPSSDDEVKAALQHCIERTRKSA